MSEKKEGKKLFSGLANLPFIQKLKSVKHIGIIIAIIFLALLLIIAFSGNFTASVTTSTDDNTSYYYKTSQEWIDEMEQEIKTLVSTIKNAGKVQVMVTLDSAPEIILASNVEQTTNTSTSSSGTIETVTVATTPFVLDDESNTVLIISEKLPTIKGIVVVASGASDVNIKLNILMAIQTLFTIENSNIQILVGN